MNKAIDEQLLTVHGDSICTCGVPRASPHTDKNGFCSYPHGMLPTKPIPGVEGWASWELPGDTK